MATCSLPRLRSSTRWRVVSLQCAVCTFGNRAGRKQLRCCALLASPPPPLYCNASSHFALVRLASTGSAMAGPAPLRSSSRQGTSREIAQSRAGPCRTRADPARRGLGSCKLATAAEVRHVEKSAVGQKLPGSSSGIPSPGGRTETPRKNSSGGSSSGTAGPTRLPLHRAAA